MVMCPKTHRILTAIVVAFAALVAVSAEEIASNKVQTVNATIPVGWRKRTRPLPVATYTLTMWNLLLGFTTSFLVGANDAANSWATTVGSGVLTWGTGRFFAAFFEIAGGMISNSVSDKIKKVANPTDRRSFADGLWKDAWDEENEKDKNHGMDLWPTGMVASQVGATVWQGTVTLLGIPSSGTHSVVGSVVGASATNDWDAPDWDKFYTIALGWFISPMAAAFLACVLLWWAVSYMPVRTVDLIGSKYKACKTLLVFPIFATGFIFVMVGVKIVVIGSSDEDQMWKDVRKYWGVGIVAILSSFFLAMFQSSLNPANKAWLQFECCCTDGKQPVARAIFFGFFSMWLMVAASTTLLLKKNANFAGYVGFIQGKGISNLNQTPYFMCLGFCLIPAVLAGLVVYKGMTKPIRQADVSDLENGRDITLMTRLGNMSPNLAVALNRDPTWIGAVRVKDQDGAWKPSGESTSSAGSRYCPTPIELLGKVLCKWVVPSKEHRTPQIVEYSRENADDSPDDGDEAWARPKVIFTRGVFGFFRPAARANQGSQLEVASIEMTDPVFDQLQAQGVKGLPKCNEVVVVRQETESQKDFALLLCDSVKRMMMSLFAKLRCRAHPKDNDAVKVWLPKENQNLQIAPGIQAICMGEGKEGEIWFEFKTKSGGDLTGKQEQDAVNMFKNQVREAGAVFQGAEFWIKENKSVEVSTTDPDYKGAIDRDVHQLELERLKSKRLHDSFKWLLAVCACMQSFVHGANDLPNAAAAVTAFKDYRDAANNGDCAVYASTSSNATGLGTCELFTICAMLGAGVIICGSGVISSMSQVMGPELQGAHLMAYCIEVAAQLSAATFTCLDMPISTTHCEVGALCLVSFLLNGKLNQEKVCGIVFALFTAATMSGVLSYFAMNGLEEMTANWEKVTTRDQCAPWEYAP